MNTLITGTSRGIGFALVLQALGKGQTVFAVARDTAKLKSLKQEFPARLHLIEANVSQNEGIEKIVQMISTQAGSLDVLINNAGVYKQNETVEDFAESFHVNAITPFLLTKALVPYLAKAKQPKVIQISTLMASIADNSSGGSYAYRSSKAALNMITKSLAIEFPQIAFALIHPGWVKTEMGGAGAPVEIEESAKGIWREIDATDLRASGIYKDFRGRELSW